MSHPATRRTFVAAAAALPLAAAARSTFAQDATPAASETESIVRAFYEPFNTGDTTIYDTILAEDWVSIFWEMPSMRRRNWPKRWGRSARAATMSTVHLSARRSSAARVGQEAE